MSEKTAIRSLLLATGSFIGGVTLGLLLTPTNGRQNRAWISEHASRLPGWIDRQRKTVSQKGQSKLQEIRQHVHDGLQQNIPDPFKATEQIDMDNQDLTGA